mmetsp:Transcript_11593/g.41356  ORF Transcript_11593/g.41356 Transcript_11593/m.41356 type:complete len:225 (+) Transcript_11593:1574-2248(+)
MGEYNEAFHVEWVVLIRIQVQRPDSIERITGDAVPVPQQELHIVEAARCVAALARRRRAAAQLRREPTEDPGLPGAGALGPPRRWDVCRLDASVLTGYLDTEVVHHTKCPQDIAPAHLQARAGRGGLAPLLGLGLGSGPGLLEELGQLLDLLLRIPQPPSRQGAKLRPVQGQVYGKHTVRRHGPTQRLFGGGGLQAQGGQRMEPRARQRRVRSHHRKAAESTEA